MKLKHLLLACALAPCQAWAAVAQTADMRRAVDQPTARRAAEKRAVELLEGLLEESRSLRLAENRAWVGANAASLLWAHDEGRARRLFQLALADIDESAAGVEDNDPRHDDYKALHDGLRAEVLRMLGRHDLPLAMDLLRRAKEGARPDRIDFGLQLALQAAAENPRQAMLIAEQSLSDKVSYQLPSLVAELHEKDPASASTLVADIISKLHSLDLTADEEAATVAAELLQSGPGPSGVASVGAADAPVSTQSRKELAEMMATAALSGPADSPNLLHALRSVLPEVELYAPALASRIRRKVAGLARTSDRPDGSGHDSPATRRGAATEDAYRPHEREETPRELIERARESALKGEKGLALGLLEEAANRVDLNSPARNSAQLKAQLDVARAYAMVAPDKALEFVESIVDRLNTLADAVVSVDGFLDPAGAPLARSDELIMQSLYQYVGGREYAESFAPLTGANFERAARAADGFRRAEVRILVRLLFIRALLTER